MHVLNQYIRYYLGISIRPHSTIWNMRLLTLSDVFKIGPIMGGVVLWHSALSSCLMSQNPIWVLVYVPMIPLSDQFLAFHLEKQRKMAQALGLASMWETEKFPCSWLWMGPGRALTPFDEWTSGWNSSSPLCKSAFQTKIIFKYYGYQAYLSEHPT